MGNSARFTPDGRRVHRQSSIELAQRCHRAWALSEIEEISQPEVKWADIESGKVKPVGGQRSTALGTRVHSYAEWYLTGAASTDPTSPFYIDWSSIPGQVFQSMLPHLPPAGSIPPGDVEREFWAFEAGGVLWKGTIDLLGSGPDRGGRWPGLPDGDVWDHKTTRDIVKYAKLPHDVAVDFGVPERSLRDNLQACLYSLRAATYDPRTNLPRKQPLSEIRGRWTYAETDRVRRSLPVLQTIRTEHARVVVADAARLAAHLERYQSSADAPPNTLACDDYGGCWFRREGHCKAPRDYGRIMRALERKQEQEMKRMAEGKKLSWAELKARGSAPAPAAAPAPTAAKPTPKRKPAVAAPAAAPEPEPETEEQAEEESGEESLSLHDAVLLVQGLLAPGVTVSISGI